MTHTREEVLGAVARGWTHPSNSHKVMDEHLAYAIADEIEKLLCSRQIVHIEIPEAMSHEEKVEFLAQVRQTIRNKEYHA